MESSMQLLFKDLDNYPVLKPDEEKRLFILAKAGDKEAKDIIVNSNVKLISSIAKQYQNCGLEFADLFSEGILGIIEAVDNFDIDTGNKFSTYCVWKIRQKISRAVANQGRMIRLPVYVVESINKIKKAERELLVELNREPTEDEIIKRAKVSKKDFEKYKDNAIDAASLDIVIDEDSGASIGDLIEDNYFVNPLDNYIEKTRVDEICKVLDTLDKEEADVIKYLYGFKNDGEFSIEKAKTKEIEDRAFRKLRSPSRMRILKDLAFG